MGIERIGVIGAGQMGNGIAHVLSLAGFDVMLEDVNSEQLGKALERITKNMRRQAARGLIKDEAVESALKRIHNAENLDAMQDRDLVIEAATEDETVKRKIFQDLCPRIDSPASNGGQKTSREGQVRVARRSWVMPPLRVRCSALGKPAATRAMSFSAIPADASS